jgi:hypothetical protein
MDIQTQKQYVDERGYTTSCEMIQEIYGLGAYYLLRESEEVVFERLMSKYQRTSSESGYFETELVLMDKVTLETLIRRALSERKAELATSTASKVRPHRSAFKAGGRR